MRLLVTAAAVAACLAVGMCTAQEILNVAVKSLPDVKGSADADVEMQFAKGALKLEDVCGKVKDKQAKVTFGCEKASSLKDAKKIWEKNDEKSAWEALAAVDEAKFGKDETRAFVNQVMEDALGSVKIDAGKLSFGKVAPGETTGRLIFACSRLNECLKRTLTGEERIAVSEFLLSINPVTSGVALGLRALSDFGMASVVLKQEKNSQTANVLVTSLIGKQQTWKLGSGTSKLVSATGKADEVKVTFDGKGKVAKVPVEVEVATGAKQTLFLQFEVTATIGSSRIVVKDKNVVQSEHALPAFPAQLGQVVSVDRGDIIEISIQISTGDSPICPDQALFGFVSDSAQYLVPGSCTNKEVRVSLSNGIKVAEELGYASGTYDVVFIASDEGMSNPILWRLSRAKLSLSPPPEKKHEALFTHHLLYESDSTLKALPEIHHQFRQPDRRAPEILSFLFSSAHLGVLGAFLLVLLNLGFRPLDIFKSLRVMLFTVTLTLVEVVFFWYWIGPKGAPNMETFTYTYIPPMLLALLVAMRLVLSSGRSRGSEKKTASM